MGGVWGLSFCGCTPCGCLPRSARSVLTSTAEVIKWEEASPEAVFAPHSKTKK